MALVGLNSTCITVSLQTLKVSIVSIFIFTYLFSIETAFEMVRKKRAMAEPNANFMDQLVKNQRSNNS